MKKVLSALLLLSISGCEYFEPDETFLVDNCASECVTISGQLVDNYRDRGIANAHLHIAYDSEFRHSDGWIIGDVYTDKTGSYSFTFKMPKDKMEDGDLLIDITADGYVATQAIIYLHGSSFTGRPRDYLFFDYNKEYQYTIPLAPLADLIVKFKDIPVLQPDYVTGDVAIVEVNDTTLLGRGYENLRLQFYAQGSCVSSIINFKKRTELGLIPANAITDTDILTCQIPVGSTYEIEWSYYLVNQDSYPTIDTMMRVRFVPAVDAISTVSFNY